MAGKAVGREPEASARRNVELKTLDPPPGGRSGSAASSPPRTAASSTSDIYFHVPRGRLKLREEGDQAWLIPYHRFDRVEARLSCYSLIDASDTQALRRCLEATLGVRVVVEKERRLFLWRGARIHLDRVAALGTFLELEAVTELTYDLAAERSTVEHLRMAFGITPDRLVAAGYADLMLPRSDHRRQTAPHSETQVALA